ncbi:MAG TPA: kelch repeat-containing protein [Candidatus Thermoplasmatota archaeon]|nr:kelch repeat-containing protein [Candidatus Thermoplasmatota archaeon]
MVRTLAAFLAALAASGCLASPPEGQHASSASSPAPTPTFPDAIDPASPALLTLPFRFAGTTEGEACLDVAGETCQETWPGQDRFWRLPLASAYGRLAATFTWEATGPDGFYVALYQVEGDGARASLADAGFVARGHPPLDLDWDLSALGPGLYDLGAFDGLEERPVGAANAFLGKAVAFAAHGTLDLAAHPQAGEIRPVAPMSVRRAGHTATALPSSRVLVAGGFDAENHPLASAEAFDPASGTFRSTGSMAVAREGHEAVLLADGRVLVAGGFPRLASAEIYSEASGSFARLPDMQEGRHGFTATLLPDGKVLLAGGGTRGAEVFDPQAGTFVRTGAMAWDRMGHTATLLPGGIAGMPLPGPKVLVAGGRTLDGRILADAEAYDVATGVFLPAGMADAPRYKHAAALGPDGRVRLVGGADGRDWEGQYADIEAYDPGTGRFGPDGNLATSRFKHGHALVDVGGRTLVAGGGEHAEVLAPEGSLPVPGLPTALYVLAAAPIPGGALIVGGYDGDIQTTDGAWVYTAPPLPP